MGKSRKGGYKLVSLQFIELTTMTALAGLYGAIANSHEKPLLISDIKVDGAKKNDIYCLAIKGEEKFIVKGIYGYDLEVNANDEVTITESDDGDVTLEVEDIKALTDDECNMLKCGDKVLKITNGQKHLYLVTYKKVGEGMCLTYMDASVVETQSYDFTGGHWAYNSEDKMPLVDVEGAESGTIVDALGLNAQGRLVKGAIDSGIKLYNHFFTISNTAETKTQQINFISKRSTPYTALYEVYGKYEVVSVQPLKSTSAGGSITFIDLASAGGSYLYKVVIDSNGTSYSMETGGYNKILSYTPTEL